MRLTNYDGNSVFRHEPLCSHSENPTENPTDQSDTTGRIRHHRTNPTPPDHSDRLQPPQNPPVVGSIPTGPTSSTALPVQPAGV
jgi:hypothetical protein